MELRGRPMTTETEAIKVTEEDYNAALERIGAYREQLAEADQHADLGTLDRARDLELLYQDMRWLDEVPAPKNTIWRGRPVDPRSRNRFAQWVLQKTGLHPSRVRQLHNASEMVGALIDTGVSVIPPGEGAVRPLFRLRRAGYGDHIAAVYKRAVELADGSPPTARETKKAVRDFLAQYTPSQRRTASETERRAVYRRRMSDSFLLLLEADPVAAHDALDELIKAYNERVGGGA